MQEKIRHRNEGKQNERNNHQCRKRLDSAVKESKRKE